uniref:Gag-pol polyprotein n=1 Tax=Angiostrongylus cantonensis TaxID=6313 RepID=A0A0K0DHS6_ANGCA
MAPLPLPLLSNGTNEELSLHEIRIANAIRVGPGNYRLAVPSISMNKIMAKPVTSESASSGSNERPNVVESQVDVDIYEEVAGTGEYDYTSGDVLSPSLVSESRDVVPGATYRELKGENKYLKEQLHANVLRIKQLEALLVLRNGHVKTLVSDNLQLLLKCQKLMEALGEEEAKEVLLVFLK